MPRIEEWQCHPKAEQWFYALLSEYLEKNQFLRALKQDLLSKTSTNLFDWIDYFAIDATSSVEQDLLEYGFEQESASPTYRVFYHPGAQFPRVLVRDSDSKQPLGVAIKVESIADFLLVHGSAGCIEGSPFSPYRRCLVSKENDICIFAIERRGSRSMEPYYAHEDYIDHYMSAMELWQGRSRSLENEQDLMAQLILLAEELALLVGQDVAAWIIMECERKYWQARNTAAQIQKNRQDQLGMGWANHDHHTFRSSRALFSQLVRLFETVGFHCRERFYAGKEAGWGAQVMESSVTGLVLFLDLDLTPEELEIDFAHHILPKAERLGTVGLWCALHGDSILNAGMHHLEAQFDFDKLSLDLKEQGIGMMDPFSDFPYLHQAFTEPEQWTVSPKRIHLFVENGLISHEEADHFLKEGAIGSHLENLQRKEGYKGFNKDNVSQIIHQTNPRVGF